MIAFLAWVYGIYAVTLLLLSPELIRHARDIIQLRKRETND